MRIDLPDGQWAELRESITHGEDKQIRAGMNRASDSDDEQLALDTLVVRIYTKSWSVNDPDGNAIALTDEDAIDRAPDTVVDELVQVCSRLWNAGKQPAQSYSALIGRLILGQVISDKEIDKLPDPQKFRDAVFLANNGRWSPRDLDEMDRELLALVKRLQARPNRG